MQSFLASRWVWLLVAVFGVLFLSINPTGYVAGGGDDGRYLDAALCWARHHGMCVPTDHWSTRWPAVAPQAILADLFGETRAAVSFGSLLSWIAAVAAIGWLGSFWFTRNAGLIAAALFITVPIAADLSMRPNVDIGELAAQCLAIGFATLACRKDSKLFAVLAGLIAALAFEARDTSLLFAGFGTCAWWVLEPEHRRKIPLALLGFAAVIGAEMLAYWVTTGDPLLRFKLSLHHGAVPSTALKPDVDTSHSPILNPDFIAGWKRPLGIEVWWPIDSWLNLIPDKMIGPWLVAGPVLAGLAWREGTDRAHRRLKLIGAMAMMMAVGLIYVLAIDPRPRMFLFAAAASCLAFGWGADRLFRSHRPVLPIILFVGLVGFGAFVLKDITNIRPFERAMTGWLETYPRQIEADPVTKSMFALVPNSSDIAPANSGRPKRAVVTRKTCPQLVEQVRAKKVYSVVDSRQLRDRTTLCLLQAEGVPSR